ncbi:MAG: lipid A deacylase LpxR family protein [Alphaproteobacteria bacterium]|nr:lipid A deacylase LpxR family protein [Alphaproteobacteria bacterium]
MIKINKLAALLILVSVSCLPRAALAQDIAPPSQDTDGRLGILEENDYFGTHDDRHYTQGLKLSYLSKPVTPDGGWDQPFGMLNDAFGIYGGDSRKRKYEWTALGQSIFTPTYTNTPNPSPNDRPYAAWLYTGASLLQDTDHGWYHTLENTELDLGVVGPPALGEVTQNDYHQFINVTPALGWHDEIHTEPGAILSYEKKWRFQQPLIGNLAIDAIPEAGATVGNILTYGDIGGMVRFGQNLGADYGPNRIRPSPSGTAWFDPDQLDGRPGWYIFAGTQGRAMGHNVFLQGNSFAPSYGVEEKPLVADFIVGASLFWNTALRVDATMTERTKEFYGQQGHPDRFGGINLTIGF